MNAMIIPTSVFGAERVKGKGQHLWASLIRSSGGEGIEIRRELFPSEALPLDLCREAAMNEKLRCVYSVPVEIWDAGGKLNEAGFMKALREARTLKPEMLKVSLGHFHETASGLRQLEQLLEQYRCEAGRLTLLVENDQTLQGGQPARLLSFFQKIEREGIQDVRMTFDTGNWAYCGEDAFDAARVLSRYVAYIHLKHVEKPHGTCVTLPLPPEADAQWRKLLEWLPGDVPRAIEFELPGADSLAYYINLAGRAHAGLVSEEGR